MAAKRQASKRASAKGAEWERAVCQSMSIWISGGTREDLFWRAAMSGGRATLASRSGRANKFSSVGDITAVDKLGIPFLEKFSIECKFYKDLRMAHPIFGHHGEREVIWDKPLAEAEDKGKHVIVAAKQNRQRPIALISHAGVVALKKGVRPGVSFKPRAVLVEWGCQVFDLTDLWMLDPKKVC